MNAAVLAAVHAGVAQVSGAGDRFRFFPPEAATSAGQVDAIYLALIAFAAVFTLAIFGLIIFFAIKYRAGSGADRSNQITETTRFEVIWAVVPTVLALGLFAWAGWVYVEQSRPPADAHTVYVVGKQWMWKIQHPEGAEEINELHVPAGIPIKLVMTSQDVIHSFFVPAFRLKQDVLPDRYTTLWFQATTPGRYEFFCAEYCGLEHSKMRGQVVVMEPAAFARWLSSEAARAPAPGEPGTESGPMAVSGEGPFFRYGCNACHLPTSAVRAPRLDGLYGSEVRLANGDSVTADEEYIRESILDPQAKISAGYPSPSLMPTYRGQVSEADLRALVEFVKSLQDGWPEEVEQP